MIYGFNLKFGKKLYYVICSGIEETKKTKYKDEGFTVGISFRVKDVEENKYLTWTQIKKLGIDAEIATFARNSINGQRTTRWKKDGENENGKFIRVYPESTSKKTEV